MEDLYVAEVSAERFKGKRNKMAVPWCSLKERKAQGLRKKL